MKRFTLIVSAIFALGGFVPTATAEVREIKSIAEAEPEIDHETLVIFDLDNTVIESKTALGGDAWFTKILAEYRDNGVPDAVERAVARWSAIQRFVEVAAVEPRVPEYIAELQAKGVRVIALTARPDFSFVETERQLHSVNVSFEPTTLSAEDVRFDLGRPVLFSKGILQVNNTNKGLALLKLLEIVGYQPKRIVFVDDKEKNVKDVDAALNAAVEYPHIEFRYGAADPRVARYDHDIAKFQEARAGRILSDVEAKTLQKAASSE